MSHHRPGNLILRAMQDDAFEALRPDLAKVVARREDVLIRQGEPVRTVHFPVQAVLGNILGLSEGATVETAAVGRDSVSGLAAVFADAPIAWSVRVQVPGELWALPADCLKNAMNRHEGLRALLLRVTYDAQCQAALNAACNAEHEALQRLCKWLLLLADRSQTDRLSLTQQEIANLLGAERTTINGALQALRDRNAIEAARGRIEITDYSVLKRFACACYGMQWKWTQTLGLPV